MPPRSAAGAGEGRTRSPVTARYGDIEVRGAKEAAANIQKSVTIVNNRKTLVLASKAIYEAIERLFEKDGGGEWAPTKKQSVEEKRRKGLQTRPMRATGRLLGSMTHPPPYRGSIRKIEKGKNMVISSEYPWLGIQARRGRKATIIDAQGRREVAEIISKAIDDGLKLRGSRSG